MRRELTLLDSSSTFVSLALFGVQALHLPQSTLADTPLVAIKGDQRFGTFMNNTVVEHAVKAWTMGL